MRHGLVCALLGCIWLAVACDFNPLPNTPTPTQPTAAPTAALKPTATFQLSAQAKDTVIILTWTAPNGASGYNVYRDGNTSPLNTEPITKTTYQDIGLTNGRAYTYTVAPVSADGSVGSRSAPVVAAPKSP